MSRLRNHLSQKYQDAKILILGWGREGQSSYAMLRQCCPEAQVQVSDQSEKLLAEWQDQHHQTLDIAPYLKDLSSFDVIFKTPGIPTGLPELQSYRENGGKLTCQLNEFLTIYRQQTIGVTGTKGKSTTASLITHICRKSAQSVVFAGNIGTPVFEIDKDLSPGTLIVVEMSSYQLETVTVSPHIAVWLNIFPEHLNYHQNLGNYIHAKANITQFQTAEDVFIYNQDVEEITRIAKQSRAQLQPFSYRQKLVYPKEARAVLDSLTEVTLPPTIKKWNLLPAILAATTVGLSAEQIIKSLPSFQTLSHRLETVGVYRDITWIDDLLATIPEATIAALEALPRVDVLLLGGYDRGISFDKIVDICIEKKVPAIGFFKPSGQTMYELLQQKYPKEEWPVMKIVENMEEAVRFGYQHAKPGGTVLLSPSSPSFGQFRDYRDKSAQFHSWIEKLAKEITI